MNKSPLWLRIAKRNKNATLNVSDVGPGIKASFKFSGATNYSSIVSTPTITDDHKPHNEGSSVATAVTVAAVAAAIYSPTANASIVDDLTNAITNAITKPLEKMSQMFTDAFSSIMDKGNQEKIVAVAKGQDSINEVLKYAYNQRLFAESQPDPMHCDAEDRARSGKKAIDLMTRKRTINSSQTINSNVNTTSRGPAQLKNSHKRIVDGLKLVSTTGVSFNSLNPYVLRGRTHDRMFDSLSPGVDPNLPKAQTHSAASESRARSYINALKQPLDQRLPAIDVELLNKNDVREEQKLVVVAAKRARTAILMQPFNDELAERSPLDEIGGKSKAELMHEAIHNTYYSEEYNAQLSQLAAPTPALIAIAKSLSFSNMLAFEALQVQQQQNQLIAVVGSESMDRNNAIRKA